MPFRLHHRGKDADGDGAEDDEEAEAGRDFYVWHIGQVAMQQELDADEDEHDAESVLQIGEILRDGGEGKIECTQAEDGEDVGR